MSLAFDKDPSYYLLLDQSAVTDKFSMLREICGFSRLIPAYLLLFPCVNFHSQT